MNGKKLGYHIERVEYWNLIASELCCEAGDLALEISIVGVDSDVFSAEAVASLTMDRDFRAVQMYNDLVWVTSSGG